MIEDKLVGLDWKRKRLMLIAELDAATPEEKRTKAHAVFNTVANFAGAIAIDAHELAESFLSIDWHSLDVDRILAFYDAVERPVEQRALLLLPPIEGEPSHWQRQCLTDFFAMLGDDFPLSPVLH